LLVVLLSIDAYDVFDGVPGVLTHNSTVCTQNVLSTMIDSLKTLLVPFLNALTYTQYNTHTHIYIYA
jgi:hypothetical protein